MAMIAKLGLSIMQTKGMSTRLIYIYIYIYESINRHRCARKL